jgi:hypothetical protein
MRFVETIAGELGHLVEDMVGEIRVDAAPVRAEFVTAYSVTERPLAAAEGSLSSNDRGYVRALRSGEEPLLAADTMAR